MLGSDESVPFLWALKWILLLFQDCRLLLFLYHMHKLFFRILKIFAKFDLIKQTLLIGRNCFHISIRLCTLNIVKYLNNLTIIDYLLFILNQVVYQGRFFESSLDVSSHNFEDKQLQ